MDEVKQNPVYITADSENLKTNSDQFDIMEVDEEFVFDGYRQIAEEEHIEIDAVPHLEDLQIRDQFDIMEIDEQFCFENFENIDSASRDILDNLLLVLDFNDTTYTDHIACQAQIIKNIIEESPFITVHSRDQSVRLQLEIEYSVHAFDSIYARTCTTADGNCLYSSLSIINIGSEKLTHSMRLLAVHAMIDNKDYFRLLCASLNYSFEEQLQRTARNTTWGGEVQIQALSVALCHPIYSYNFFVSDRLNRHYIPSSINLEELRVRG